MPLPSLTEILRMMDLLLQLKKQIEDGIASIADTAMRKNIEKNYKGLQKAKTQEDRARCLAELHKLILGRDN